MTAQELKNSILQLAIQGKLVEQRPEEGNAQELIDKLLESKKKLIKSREIYIKKQTDPFYNLEELPFEIPETWRWVQLSEVSIIQEGAGIRKHQYTDSGIQLFSVTNILDGAIDLEKKQLYVSTEEFKEKYTHLQLNKGDIVTACSGGSWGKASIYDSESVVMLNTSTLRLRFFEDIGNNYFLYYMVKCNFFKNQLQKQLVGIQPNFGYAHYSRICLPIPPLDEQKRIVAKIEELLPYVEQYDKAYSKLEVFNKKFPEDMQKSILQYAIQGKLVEQRPEEGSAEELYQQIQAEKAKLIKEGKIKKEKPLGEITDEEIPFEIPESWKWVRLGEISKNIQYGFTASACECGNTRLLRITDIQNNKVEWSDVPFCEVTENEFERYELHNRDIMIARTGGTIGKSYIVDKLNERTVFASYLIRIIPVELINEKFLKLFMETPLYWKQLISYSMGTGQPNVNGVSLSMLVLPIPPIMEQQRIVDEINEYLPYCQKLVK